jgi:hypothetical protein
LRMVASPLLLLAIAAPLGFIKDGPPGRGIERMAR